jgi:uncharacterized protein YutE (UPF0331/DUF86 family)
VPESNAAAVRELGAQGVVPQPVAEAIAGAVGFRNVLVPEYADVDDLRVVRNLGRIEDSRQFVAAVAAWLEGATAS